MNQLSFSQAYKLDETLKMVMDELVTNPFQSQSKIKSWVQEVLNKGDAYQRKEILNQGRANFAKPIRGLSPEQTVLLYCRHYLQMHLASSRYVFDICHQLWDENPAFLDDNSVLIDFGCGPLTSALALAWYSDQVKKTQLKLNYLGIDRAEAMLEKARQFSRHQALFSRSSNFHFVTHYTDDSVTRYIEQCTQNYPPSWIVLNFSYFFASPWLDAQKFSCFINQLLNRFSQYHFCLLFQNPPGELLNQKWIEFKDYLEVSFQCLKSPQSISSSQPVHYLEYPLNSTVKINQPKPPIRLYYEILVNQHNKNSMKYQAPTISV